MIIILALLELLLSLIAKHLITRMKDCSRGASERVNLLNESRRRGELKHLKLCVYGVRTRGAIESAARLSFIVKDANQRPETVHLRTKDDEDKTSLKNTKKKTTLQTHCRESQVSDTVANHNVIMPIVIAVCSHPRAPQITKKATPTQSSNNQKFNLSIKQIRKVNRPTDRREHRL